MHTKLWLHLNILTKLLMKKICIHQDSNKKGERARYDETE